MQTLKFRCSEERINKMQSWNLMVDDVAQMALPSSNNVFSPTCMSVHVVAVHAWN